MKPIYEMKPTYLNSYSVLSQNDMPPTLYSLMESKVNFDRQPSEKVSISNLPNAFKSYLFDFNYPLNTNLKNDFEILFLKHYMFRRINYDTYLSFKLHLEVKLNDIMPKYNKMFEGFNSLDFEGVRETIERDNLNSRVINETETGTNNITNSVSNTGTSTGSSSGTNTSSSSSTNDNRFSDVPQNSLADVRNGSYVTDYTYNQGSDSSSSTSSSSSSTSTSNSKSDLTSATNSKTNNKIDNDTENESITKIRLDTLDEYKKFLEYANNIYSMIFKECDSLFYGVTPL